MVKDSSGTWLIRDTHARGALDLVDYVEDHIGLEIAPVKAEAEDAHRQIYWINEIVSQVCTCVDLLFDVHEKEIKIHQWILFIKLVSMQKEEVSTAWQTMTKKANTRNFIDRKTGASQIANVDITWGKTPRNGTYKQADSIKLHFEETDKGLEALKLVKAVLALANQKNAYGQSGGGGHYDQSRLWYEDFEADAKRLRKNPLRIALDLLKQLDDF